MIVSIWVFLILGEPVDGHPGTPYVQAVAPAYVHDHYPERVEAACAKEFHRLYPDACVCDSGWHIQEVKVMGS